MLTQQNFVQAALAVWRQSEPDCYSCDQPGPIAGVMAHMPESDPGGIFVAPICAACMIRAKNSDKARRRLEAKLGREVAR